MRKRRNLGGSEQQPEAGGETDDERSQRLKVLQDARKAEEEKAREEEERKAREEARRKEEEERKALEAAREGVKTPEELAVEAAAAEGEPAAADVSEPEPETEIPSPAEEPAEAGEKKPERKGRAKDREKEDSGKAKRPREEGRREGKLTISAALSGSEEEDRFERGRSLASIRRARAREQQRTMKTGGAHAGTDKIVREVTLPETISVQELAARMTEKGANVIKTLMKLGVMANINETIDADTAQLVVEEMGHKPRRVSEADVEEILEREADPEESLKSRPPVVTVMGHVDHGKTSLLDALRTTDVASGEAGGITQHIGAYQVRLKDGGRVTFVDTPGHAAFTEMRARGARVTDIVILVVAADDGIKPQTVEAIRHARAAEVPIVVAINKMDRPGADPERVRTDLLSHEIVVEEMGGEVLNVEISAKNRENLDKLMEALQLQAELLDLKANPDRAAEGVVVEAKMERGRGSVATVLIQRGTLSAGEIFVAGREWGRVRALLDDRGQNVENAPPAYPVEVIGLQGTPMAGDDFVVLDSETRAREIAGYRQRKEREALQVKSASGSMDQIFEKISAGEAKEVGLVIKGDVQGSVEAINSMLEKLSTDEVKVNILHSAVGGINQSDITLAKASDGIVIGFNVRANPQAREMANRDGVEIRYYSVIYEVAEDVRKAMEGLLAPELREKILGYAEIREIFSVPKVGKVAGCRVTEGCVRRGSKVRIIRDDVVVYEGDLSQLKRFKEDAKEVREGYECGMSFEGTNDIREGDRVECFDIEEVAVTLD